MTEPKKYLALTCRLCQRRQQFMIHDENHPYLTGGERAHNQATSCGWRFIPKAGNGYWVCGHHDAMAAPPQ